MEGFSGDIHYLIYGIIFVFGIIATAGYYFARYYFKMDDQDQEVVGRLKEAAPTQFPGASESEKIKVPAEVEASEPAPAAQKSPLPLEKAQPKKAVDLKEALGQTKANILGRIKSAFVARPEMESDDLEYLEEVLYTSDLGPQTVQRLIEAVGEKLTTADKADLEKVRAALRDEMMAIFESLDDISEWKIDEHLQVSKPTVWMIVGVNGVGKTTTIGKLASKAQSLGLKTLVVAGDTFRAAAEDQLKVWSERAGVEIFSPEGVKDPSAVAFDGIKLAQSRGFDLVIVDTAGRLHTQDNLMEELKKMKRVMTKVVDDAPHETLLVLDANSGQNALMQAKIFNETLELSGVVLTKLDGTAKGGVAVGLACEYGLPIRWIGVGESADDLRPFRHKEFVESII